ncbi:MAG: hypothetical protein JKX98_12860 [Alcanivoracaceae bacterium]|nr:hypothetical protein [Alcanivoracaceae bacterium]
MVFQITSAFAFESNVQVDNAARKGNVVKFEKFLIKDNNPDQPNKFGFVALTGASGKCTKSHLKALELLIRFGAEVNRKSPNGTTSLNS